MFMDLRKAVTDSLDRLIASEAVEKIIETQLQKTITTIVQDALSSYSEFGNQVKASVCNAMKISERIDLPEYNDTILKIIRRHVDAGVNNMLQRQVEQHMADLLVSPPAEIRVSELVEAFRKDLEERDDDCSCEAKKITFQLDLKDHLAGYWSLKLDKDRDAKYCDIQLSVDREGRIYWMSLNREDVDKRLFLGSPRGFERMLLQMKQCGTKLINDSDEAYIETSYGGHD